MTFTTNNGFHIMFCLTTGTFGSTLISVLHRAGKPQSKFIGIHKVATIAQEAPLNDIRCYALGFKCSQWYCSLEYTNGTKVYKIKNLGTQPAFGNIVVIRQNPHSPGFGNFTTING